MNGITLTPYLFFDGNCRQAMEFYQQVFGGTLQVQTYDEVPNNPHPDMQGKLIHANLKDGAIDLMASDALPNYTLGAGKISLSVVGGDETQLTEMFHKLAEGGKVGFPLKKEFWGDLFGTLTDKFGVDWMVDVSSQKAE